MYFFIDFMFYLNIFSFFFPSKKPLVKPFVKPQLQKNVPLKPKVNNKTGVSAMRAHILAARQKLKVSIVIQGSSDVLCT